MRQKIDVSLSPSEIMARYAVSKTTAYRAKKRGYLCPGYHQKTMAVGDINTFDTISAYKTAEIVYWRYFSPLKVDAFKDDIIQEGVLRMLELSGISQDFNFQYKTALYAGRSFLHREGIVRLFHRNAESL